MTATPRPWTAVFPSNYHPSLLAGDIVLGDIFKRDDAELIVRAVNAHDALVAALERFCSPEEWASEYRACQYGWCSGCGAPFDSVDFADSTTKHEDNCPVLEGRAALALACGEVP